jgi:hypothetical protein
MPSIIVVSTHGDAHSPQRQDGLPLSGLMPRRPAVGVKPCMRLRLGPEGQDNGARRLGPATPCAAPRCRRSGMLIQPLDDAAVERLELSLSAQQAAVMLQKARAFVETRSPIFCAPLGAATCRARPVGVGRCYQARPLSIFSRFSRFSRSSSAHPHRQIFNGKGRGAVTITHRPIFGIWCWPC